MTEVGADQTTPETDGNPSQASAPRRQIPGNLPYINSIGTLKRILDKIIELPKPDRFNQDFLENVVRITGGAARSCIPILKKMNFLDSSGTPTDLYSKFRTEGGRPAAAYEGLKTAFPEIFKRSDYAYSIDDAKLRDIVIEITGLKSSDTVAKAIKGTFSTIKSYIPNDFNHSSHEAVDYQQPTDTGLPVEQTIRQPVGTGALGIQYHINIVVPETSDLNILNAIFKSVKENLLT